MKTAITYATTKTPLGLIYLGADANGLCLLSWKKPQGFKKTVGKDKVLDTAIKQLTEYFQGQRKDFSIPLSAQGTEFQKSVWQQLKKIPYGKVISYSEQATRMGRPEARRAVAAANGRNPLPVIVPCHRVVAKNGSLWGYTGGLHIKEFLLNLETKKSNTASAGRKTATA